jgi:hypothetical protein
MAAAPTPPAEVPPPAPPSGHPFRWGFLVGALFGTAVALAMDANQDGPLGTGWRVAAANDLKGILGAGVTPDHPLAWAGAAVGILFMAGLGGVLAGTFAVILASVVDGTGRDNPRA